MIVTSKSFTDTAFKTPFGLVVIKGQGVLNNIPDKVWDHIYARWQKFIDKNTFSDKNPAGFFVLQKERASAKAQTEELKVNDGKDGGAPLTQEEALAVEFDGMTRKELIAHAKAEGIKFSATMKREALLALIKKEEAKK